MDLEKRIEKALTFESSKKDWRGRGSDERFIFCSRINKDLFGKHLNQSRSCECVEDFFILIKSRLKRIKNGEIMEKLFKVKSGRVVYSHALSRPLSENSTDEEAIRLLSYNANYIKAFEVYPKNWMDLVGRGAVEKIEVSTETTEEVSIETTEEVSENKPKIKRPRIKKS